MELLTQMEILSQRQNKIADKGWRMRCNMKR